MSQFVILKSDGSGQTTVMAQTQTERYLCNLVNKNRVANVKQALNDVSSGSGKATGAYTFDNKAVWHASSGNSAKSVTVFYVLGGGHAEIFAMGCHVDSSSYSVCDYGQKGTDFASGKTVSL